MGKRTLIGNSETAQSTDHIVGFMRFNSDARERLMHLINRHPVVLNGGSVELFEMPRS